MITTLLFAVKKLKSKKVIFVRHPHKKRKGCTAVGTAPSLGWIMDAKLIQKPDRLSYIPSVRNFLKWRCVMPCSSVWVTSGVMEMTYLG